MKTIIAIAAALAMAGPAWAGDKEDLAKAVKKLSDAKGYRFKGTSGVSGQSFEETGEVEFPDLLAIRHPQFELLQAGDKTRVKIANAPKWTEPHRAGGNFFWNQYTMFVYRPDLLLEAALKAEKVTSGGRSPVDGVECTALKADVGGKDLRAIVERIAAGGQKANWQNYDQYYDWENSTATITVSLDAKSGWIRRVALDFSLQMKQNMGGAQPMTAEYTLDGFDAARVNVPKILKKELGLGEG